MTTPKCPLCGGTPEYILEEGDGICEYAGCPKCGLCATPSWGDWNCNPSKEATWQRWRDLVSKFPSIMRLKQGDNVMLYDRELCAVHSVNLKYNRVVLQNCRADIMVETADKIEKWPWEFEQEGGSKQ